MMQAIDKLDRIGWIVYVVNLVGMFFLLIYDSVDLLAFQKSWHNMQCA